MGQLVRQARPGVPVLYTSGRALTDGMKELFVERSSVFAETIYRRTTHQCGGRPFAC